MKHTKFFTILISIFILLAWNSSLSTAENILYQYDNLNRLVRVEYSNGTIISYTYDAAGNRLNQAITAVPWEYTLTVEKSGTGSGSVEGSGIDCGTDCLEIYEAGTLIFLKAIADDDSMFIQWLQDGEPVVGPIQMLKPLTITAVFEKK